MRTLAKRADVQASVVAAAAALLWLLLAPRTPDLAAQSYRVGLFQREGFAIWDNGWYAGHHLPAYSLLFPPLAAALGMRVTGAIAAVVTAFCFARLADRHFGPQARAGILWFAAATATDLAIGRLTYALGTTLGMAALYATGRDKRLPAAALATLTAAATPLAGIFLALAGVTVLLRGWRARALTLIVPALGTALAMALVFPEGGRQPFGGRALLASLALTLAFVLLTRDRVLKLGAQLYFAATLGAFVLSTPIGGNTTRLGAVIAGPLLLCARGTRHTRRPTALALTLVGLLVWQWYAPVREIARGTGDPLSDPSTYTGLLAFLETHDPAKNARLEIPFTRSHWEAAIVPYRFPLARGWEKQLDAGYDPLFFAPNLRPATYRAWLDQLGVRYVAIPDAPPDPSSRAEVALVLGTPGNRVAFLHAVYRDPHWRVFAVADPTPLASPPASLTELRPQSFTLRFAAAGSSVARVRFSSYWRSSRGCVSRGPAGFTRVSAPGPGLVHVTIAFSLGRTFATGPRCADPPGHAPVTRATSKTVR